MSAVFEQAKKEFLGGTQALQAGRFAEAETHLRASLALLPGRASTLTNLGAVLLKLERPAEALAALDQALAVEPDDAAGWFQRGNALHSLDRHDEALGSYDKALAIDPALPQVWSNRGSILKDLGRLEEAATAFESALAHGADPDVHRYFLASVRGRMAPPSPPRHYVEFLFDDYAPKFEAHLVDVLNYQAHVVLANGLRTMKRRFGAALDLGCGTGLCGEQIAPFVASVDGVDLSRNMIEQARARSVYSDLVQADLDEFLQATDARYDVVLAADTFIYVGDLAAVFRGVHRVLQREGVFCFSVEHEEGELDFALRPSLRYAHSERYVRTLAAAHGFELTALDRFPIREEQQRPIDGLFVYLRRA